MFRLELYDLIVREREREVAQRSRWNSLLRQMRREADTESPDPSARVRPGAHARALRDAAEVSR